MISVREPWPAFRPCLERVLAQAGAAEIEIVVVDGTGGTLPEPWRRAPVVFVDARGRGPFELRRLGVARARGAVVALTEDHCVPAPDWCQQVLAAHTRHPWAGAIGGSVTNGATRSAIDRASFFVVHSANAPERPDDAILPWLPSPSNLSYKRDALPEDLEREGQLELELTPSLLAEGRVAFEPSARVSHAQSLGPVRTFAIHYHAGRSVAGLVSPQLDRVARRRAARGALRVPSTLLGNAMLRTKWVPAERRAVLAHLPLMVPLVLVGTAGYLVGTLAGPGASAEKAA